ncbi:MAG: ABC transporter ATP-binding protein [Rhabdochlamydiaceae bacterium]|nr:ABC transporter ATP-binding protein [Rhabdochlamydiaceae bacterium]
MNKINSTSLFRFIWKFISVQRWKFFFIYLLSLVWALDATVAPYILRLIIDAFTVHEADRAAAWPVLKGLLLMGGALLVLVESGFRARDFLQARAIPKLEADIRMAMFDHIQHHSPKYFNEHFAGSLSNKISDMTTQVTMLLQNMMIFVPAVVSCIVSIIFFYEVSPLFAMILGGWILLHLSICFAFTKKCSANSNIHGEARSSLAGKLVDSLTSNFTVNLFFRFRFEKSQIAQYQNEERIKNYNARRYVAWMFLSLSILYLAGAVVLFSYMVVCWMQGVITTGEIIQIFNTTWNVMMMLWFAGEVIPQFFQSIGIASQALTVMQDPQDVLDKPNAKPLDAKQGEIIFENVSFQYGEKELFQNKAVHIKAGEKVGLVGYSGAGKSTFVNLILRFYPVEKGRILIDGQDIAGVTLESLRSQVTLIPQDPLLFHRSLEDNIRYGRIDASKEEVIQAAKLAHCDEFIKRSPQGYASLVGERGTKLSGGERQRIAIARAMLTGAPILILDEATSALDSVTERYIQDSLEKLMQNRTTLVIAHRLSTLAKMDRILVFDHGKIVEQGSHLDLLKSGGHYARMWNMQAGGFLPDVINKGD